MHFAFRYFNHCCSQKYHSFGFVKSNYTHLRLYGDTVQAFTLKKEYGSYEYNVDFGVFPLCSPTPVYFNIGGYDIKCFLKNEAERLMRWEIDGSSEYNATRTIDKIIKVIDDYLLPFFNLCIDCKTSLTELIKLEELFETTRQVDIHLCGGKDCAISWQERSIMDPRKYYMALKSHNFTYVQQYLKYHIDLYERQLSIFKSPSSPSQPKIVINKHIEKLLLYKSQIKRLSASDFDFFDSITQYNEEKMIEYLAKNYPKLRGKGAV